MKNVFFTNSIMVREMSPAFVENDPPDYHGQMEAINKIHRFCHEIYNIPITWLSDHRSMVLYQDMYKEFMEKYGDEVALLEAGMFTENYLRGEEERYQPWVEEAGIKRPKDIVFQDELVTHVGFYSMTDEDIYKALKFMSEDYKRLFGKDLKTFANAFIDHRTVKVMKDLGITNLWGYNWGAYTEGIRHRGCPPGPFYISEENHNVPSQNRDNPIGVHWGIGSFGIGYKCLQHARGAAYCLNVLEMVNRSYGLDQEDYHKKSIREYAENGKWNPIINIPLQIEACWIDEGEVPESLERYCQFPTFNPSNTEAYYSELEECLELKIKGVTISDFCDIMRKTTPTNPEMVYISEDLVPNIRNKGKDAVYEPFIVYCDDKKQYWFSKERKFSYVRRYDYTKIPESIDIEYPFDDELRVYMKVKTSLNPTAGIKIVDDKAWYELCEWIMTSEYDLEDYACVCWQSNIPDYVKQEDIKTTGFIKRFKDIRDKILVIFFGDLKKGNNESTFMSDKPNDYIKIVRKELVGTRYEIWIENKNSEAELFHLECDIMPGLKFGGFWWNGKWHHSLYKLGWNWYDQITGRFMLRSNYPITLKLKPGLNHFDLEVLK